MNSLDGRDYLKKKMKFDFTSSANINKIIQSSFCHDIIPDDRNSLGVTIDGIMSPFMFVSQYGGDTHAGE